MRVTKSNSKSTHSSQRFEHTLCTKPARLQKGVSVAIAMIFLVMLTSLGFTALWLSSQDEKLVGLLQQEIIAFQGAETGQAILWNNNNSVSTTQTQGTGNSSTFNICATPSGECEDSTASRLRTSITINAWYVGESGSAPAGYSYDSGVSSHYFVQESISEHGAITTRIESGYYIVGPSSND